MKNFLIYWITGYLLRVQSVPNILLKIFALFGIFCSATLQYVIFLYVSAN